MVESRQTLLRLMFRLLLLWILAATVLFGQITTGETAFIAMLTAVFAALISLGGSLPLMRLAGALFALLLFVASQTSPYWHPGELQMPPYQLLTLAICVVCVLVAGLLSHVAGLLLEEPHSPPAPSEPAPVQPAGPDQRSQQRLLSAVEGILLAQDAPRGKAGVDYAEELLAKEMDRSRRCKHCFSLLLVEVVKEGDAEGHEALIARQAEDLVRGEIRVVDMLVAFGLGRYVILLPETPAEGATLLAERLTRVVASASSARCLAGIAEFSRDADSPAGLVAEAEAALEIARLSGVPVASRQMLD